MEDGKVTDMPTLYRIKDWAEHFENAESRKLKRPSWVAIPNKHDGKSFGRLRKLPDAIPAFCGWSLIIQIASKMPERGVLADEDGPLTAEDMSDATGFPLEVFVIALKVCSSKEIGWIEAVQSPETSGGSGRTSRNAGEEQNRTEQKGTEQNNSARAGAKNEVEEAFESEGITLPGVIPVDCSKPVELAPNPLGRADVTAMVKRHQLAERLNSKARFKLVALIDRFGSALVDDAIAAAIQAGATLPVGWAEAKLNGEAGAAAAKKLSQRAAMRVNIDGNAVPKSPPRAVTFGGVGKSKARSA